MIILYFTADDFTISPDMIVKPIGAVATIKCLYKPIPDRRVSWGVVKSGSPLALYPGSSSNIKFSNDTLSLTFDPITQGDGGNYYCWTPVGQFVDLYSKVVPLIIFCKLQ